MQAVSQRIGHRMSSLPIAQFCAMAPVLSQGGAGRAAAMSSAFHADCAGALEAAELFSRLTEEEQEELRSWQPPSTVVFDDWGENVVLDYASADKELALGLDEHGEYCPWGYPGAITDGHLDFAWVRTVMGEKVAYVADIKKTEWAATGGTESLQLIAYALAYASRHRCSTFVCGIFIPTEGRWLWGDPIDMLGTKRAELWTAVKFAAMHFAEDYSYGSHCSNCYGRMKCPQYVLPAAAALTALSPIAEGKGLTKEKALELALVLTGMKKCLELAEANLKEYSRRTGGIPDGKGKVWKGCNTSGRESLDKEALEAVVGDLKPFMKRGSDFQTFRWVKE